MRQTLEAIQAWRRTHAGVYPDALSALKTAGLLPRDGAICPDVLREAQRARATHHLTSSRGDGKDPEGSYEYELSNETDKFEAERRWLPSGTPPFTRKQLKAELLRRPLHEQVPILRCSSHRPAAPAEYIQDPVSLRNLTDEGTVYWSGELWEQNWLAEVPYPCRQTIVLFGLKGPPFHADIPPALPVAVDLRNWTSAFGDHPWWWTVPLFDEPPNSVLAPDLHRFFGGNHGRVVKLGPERWWANGLVQLQGKMSVDFQDVYRQSFKQSFVWERTGMPIGRKVSRASWLQGTVWTAHAGTEAGRLVWHYHDGASRSAPIVYGRDTARFWGDASQIAGEEGFPKAAWEYRQSAEEAMRERWLRLYQQSWHNPRPESEVVSLDFVSNRDSPAAPFIVAINIYP